MNDSHISSIAQLRKFIKGGLESNVLFKSTSREEGYKWISYTLCKFKYFKLRKKDKSIVKIYIVLVTGFSDAQLTRLIKKQRVKGEIKFIKHKQHRFKKKYTINDIARLAETDEVHGSLSGQATKRVFERMYYVYKDERFKSLKDISPSYIYNLRSTRWYVSKTRFFTKTKKSNVLIGKRKKPQPQGKPGFLRVDTVHQGDKNKEKGVYHVNITDEVTQWEIVRSTERITYYYLLPILQEILDKFPFKILGFHSDNGSEYINQYVAKMLNEMLIEQTKSRSLKCNDNALIETKNGAVIRKHIGYGFIPQKNADKLNDFYRNYFDEYLNYHRPCGFATIKKDRKGKEKKVYDTYLTPHEKLRRLVGISKYLKDGITLESLNNTACNISDNQYASIMQKAKQELLISTMK